MEARLSAAGVKETRSPNQQIAGCALRLGYLLQPRAFVSCTANSPSIVLVPRVFFTWYTPVAKINFENVHHREVNQCLPSLWVIEGFFGFFFFFFFFFFMGEGSAKPQSLLTPIRPPSVKNNCPPNTELL